MANRRIRWGSVPVEAASRLWGECRRWLNTPYASRSRVCGMGVDCLGFAVAVLDAMYGVESPTVVLRGVPRREVVRALWRAWHGFDTVRVRGGNEQDMGDPVSIEPGDVVVVAQWDERDLVPHVTVACVRPMMVWHATSACGVRSASLASLPPIVRTLRPRRKDLWCGDSLSSLFYYAPRPVSPTGARV